MPSKVIIPDVNLLVYAHNNGAPYHDTAKRWWESLVNGDERVAIPWVVSIGFVRIMTHPSVVVPPQHLRRRLTTFASGFG